MKNAHYLFIPLILLGVQACGGGGSDSAEPVPDTSATVDTVTDDTGSGTDNGTDLQDMVIDIHNDLTLDFPLEVSVLLPDSGDQRYLTICRYDPELEQVMRSECMFRGPLNQEGVHTTLTIARQDIELAAEVWLFVDGYSPNPYIWQYSPGSETQSFTVR